MSYSQGMCLASLPRTTRGASTVLGGDPKGTNFLYTNGNSVYMRNIENPAICDVYTQHALQVNVAKYAPSGFYIASADAGGKVRIWDTTQKEHILKYEYQPLGGAIKDLVWSPDSKRIAVCGEGREKFAHAFLWDSGSSVGEVIAHSKCINSIDMKQTRPFRLVTASEDFASNFYEGPPFKYKLQHKEHTNFANAVRYSPTGDIYVTAGADGKVFMYDGKTSEEKGELGSHAHQGGIYAVSFNSDGTQLLTVSGDKTAKIWDITSQSLICEFKMGNNLEDQQLGCLWQNEYILTVSLSGFINYLDKNDTSKPCKIVQGHNKSITSVTTSADRTKIYTGSFDSVITEWDVSTGSGCRISGLGHKNQVNGLSVSNKTMVSCGMDDKLAFVDLPSASYKDESLSMPSLPKALDSTSENLTAVACVDQVVLVRDGNTVSNFKINYEALGVSIHPQFHQLAVAGKDQKLHFYSIENDTLTERGTVLLKGEVTDVKYSPDGVYVVTSDSQRRVTVFNTSDNSKCPEDWVYHKARVNAVAWSPDSRYVASGSLDTNVIIWSIDNPKKRIIIEGAHVQNQITGISWLDNNTLVSTGQDCNTKIWTVTHH